MKDEWVMMRLFAALFLNDQQGLRADGLQYTIRVLCKTCNIEMPSQVIQRLNKRFSDEANLFNSLNNSDAYHKLNADVNL